MKGKISISKVTILSGKREEDYMSITIEDKSSGVQFLEIKMDLLDFAQALTGLGCMPIEFELRGLENVGKKFEHKTIEVTIPRDQITLTVEDKSINKAVGGYEVDGWMGSKEDCKNHHNFVKTFRSNGIDFWVYRVHFWRYIDAEEEQND